MSSPWRFLGSWFPQCELVTPVTNTGDGTQYPILWSATPGSVSADQICRFQWAAKEVTLFASGTLTVEFTDHTGGGGTDTIVQGFSTSVSQTISGADWSVREPSPDIPFGTDNTTFSNTTTLNFTYSLPWGQTGYLDVDIGFQVGLSDNLYAIDGTGFSQYTKQLNIFINAFAASDPGRIPDTNVQAFTYNPGLGTLMPFRPSVFHSDCALYTITPYGTGTISVTTLTLVVSDEFAAPPNI